MRLGIISDLHGNMEALMSLPERFDELWVLGDLVNYGPDPAEVVEFVRRRASVVIRGNHDHAIGFGEDPRCSPRFREMAAAMMEYTNSELSESDKRYLRDLPLAIEREIGGLRVSLCHAVPSEPLFAYCPPESERWQMEAQTAGTDLLFVGHTHLQFIRELGLQRVVNPGSLGQPKTGRPAACYAVWDTARHNSAVELKSFAYPVERTIAKIRALPIPEPIKNDLVDVLRQGGAR
ncbi:MAG TPA: metallophosphoesterase family protein [Bryobacteraceae bacterium]